jgi:hypothetical protein
LATFCAKLLFPLWPGVYILPQAVLHRLIHINCGELSEAVEQAAHAIDACPNPYAGATFRLLF